MPDFWMDVDTALAEVPVNILPLLDDTDFKTIEGAVAYNAAGMTLRWHFVTPAGGYTVTSVTPTTGGNYDWTDQGDSGIYTIEIPASGGASINNDTEGFGWFTGVATGVLPWRGPTIGFRAAGLNDLLIDSAYSTTRGLAGTALPAAAADAAGGLAISDAGGLDMDAILSRIGTPSNLGGGTATLAGNLADIEAQTDDIGAAGAGLTALATAAELAKVPKSDSNVSWNATALAAINAEVDTALNTAIPGSPTANSVNERVAAMDDKLLGTVAAGTHTAQTGDAYARLGAPAGASVSADVAAVKAQTAAIETDTQDLQTQVGTDGAGLTALPWNAAWDAEVQSEAADAITAAGLATAAALATVDDFLDTEIAAILADTNELQTDWANGGRLDLILDAASAPSAAAVADAVWDEAIAGHAGAGSTGAALTAAGSAGDPWSTALPGAYGAGTAGKALADVLDDTATTLPTAIADVPTVAEFDARTIAAANYATAAELAKVPKSDSNVSWNATALAAIKAEVDTALNTAIPGSPTADSINERMAALDGHITADYGATEKAAIDLLDDANGLANIHDTVDTVAEYLDTEVAAILAAVDTEVAAIKAKTDNLPASPAATGDIPAAATIAGAVWNEVSTGHTDAGKAGAQMWTDVDAILADTGTDGVVVAAGSKTGYSLAATGLDSITATEPSAKPTTFPGWVMWLVQRFRRADMTGSALTVKTEAGDTVTTQTLSDDGTTQSMGAPS